MIVRRDELRASKIMQERAFNNSKIDVLWNTEVDEVIGDDELFARLYPHDNPEDTGGGL